MAEQYDPEITVHLTGLEAGLLRSVIQRYIEATSHAYADARYQATKGVEHAASTAVMIGMELEGLERILKKLSR